MADGFAKERKSAEVVDSELAQYADFLNDKPMAMSAIAMQYERLRDENRIGGCYARGCMCEQAKADLCKMMRNGVTPSKMLLNFISQEFTDTTPQYDDDGNLVEERKEMTFALKCSCGIPINKWNTEEIVSEYLPQNLLKMYPLCQWVQFIGHLAAKNAARQHYVPRPMQNGQVFKAPAKVSNPWAGKKKEQPVSPEVVYVEDGEDVLAIAPKRQGATRPAAAKGKQDNIASRRLASQQMMPASALPPAAVPPTIRTEVNVDPSEYAPPPPQTKMSDFVDNAQKKNQSHKKKGSQK